MRKLKSALFILLIFSWHCSFSQTAATVSELDTLFQHCLDKGDDMLGCTYKYYNQMDSMLNVVYKMIRNSKDSAGKASLKSEELAWLKDRNEYFKKLDSKDYGIGGNDRGMMEEGDKARFVHKRIMELISKM